MIILSTYKLATNQNANTNWPQLHQSRGFSMILSDCINTNIRVFVNLFQLSWSLASCFAHASFNEVEGRSFTVDQQFRLWRFILKVLDLASDENDSKISMCHAEQLIQYTIHDVQVNVLRLYYYLAPHRGRARYCNAHVCLFVCLSVFLSVFSQNFKV